MLLKQPTHLCCHPPPLQTPLHVAHPDCTRPPAGLHGSLAGLAAAAGPYVPPELRATVQRNLGALYQRAKGWVGVLGGEGPGGGAHAGAQVHRCQPRQGGSSLGTAGLGWRLPSATHTPIL